MRQSSTAAGPSPIRVRVTLSGGVSGWVINSVSALWAQTTWLTCAAVQGVGRLAMRTSPA